MSWDSSACDFVCISDTECGGVCVPEATQCNDDAVETCTSEGQWQESQTCAFVCSEGQCEGVCVPGAGKCDGLVPQTCDEEGSWVDGAACDSVCSAGACTGACTPEATQCNGSVSQTCNDEGTWDDTQECNFVCSGAGDCTGECDPGASKCDGDTPEVCSAEGLWVAGTECSFLCSAGACTGVCEPGSKRCSGTGVQTCSSTGQWSTAAACPSGLNEDAVCTGQGVCGTECQDGFDDCDSTPGCEADLTDPSTCGSCGNTCSSTNGTASCNDGVCGIACNNGFENCTTAAGCETTLGTTSNCETCGDSCNANPANASPVCTSQGCDFVCDSNWGDVNGLANDGCEANLNTDPENCGSVGVSCYGGTCDSGTCSHPDIQPVSDWTVEAGQNVYGSVISIVVDNDAVYAHTDWGFILKLAKDGSESPVELAADQEAVSQNNLVVESGMLYWVTPNGLYKLSTSGGSPTQVTSHAPLRFDVENSKVYWNEGVTKLTDHCTTSCTTKFWQVSINGGSPTSYTFSGTYHADLKVKGTALYATKFTYNSTYSTFWIDTHEFVASTGAFTKAITGLIAPMHDYDMTSPAHNYGAFALNGTHLFFRGYFDDDISDGKGGSSRIGRAPLAGSSSTNNIELSLNPGVSPDTQLDDIEADSSYVYFNSTDLVRVAVGGGTPEVLTPATHSVSTLALDSEYVYWATLLDNTARVFRAPK